MKKIAPVVLVLVLLTGMFFVAACGGGSSSSKNAALRVVNANGYSAGSAGYDYLIAGTSIATGLTFGNASSYATIASGSQTVEVRNSGNSTDLIDTSQNFTGGTTYTFLTLGTATSTTGSLLTDTTTAATSGNFELRFVNGSTALSSLDVYIVPSSGNCGSYLFGVSADISGLPLGNASAYKTFAAGTFQLCITAAGGKTPYYYGGNSTYASGAVETIVIEDNGGSFPLQIQTLTDATGS